jgi:hypothetical protein
MQYDDAVFRRRLRQDDLWRKLFPAEHEAEAGVRYLEPPDAAKFTNLSTTFLARARVDGNGPTFVKVGRKILYETRDLVAWMNSQKRQMTRAAQARSPPAQ